MRRGCGDCPSLYRGTVITVPYSAKNPPIPKNQGISHINCSTQYAERRLSDPHNAGPHEFYSSFDKQNVGQFGSRHCRATGRAVLLDCRQAKSIRHEFARRGSLQKSPGSEEPGDLIMLSMTSAVRPTVFYSSFDKLKARTVCQRRLAAYSWGPAATRALPSSLPVYFSKFLMKRADRSLALVSHSAASA